MNFLQSPIGISDLAVYLPQPRIDMETIVARREKNARDPRVAKAIRRAMEYTGQKSMRFPELWEDSVTMGAQATIRLIQNNPHVDLSGLRYLVVGTETTVDHSKPIASYIGGALQKAGLPVPQSMSTYQTQHACAGGTISLFNVGAMLSMSANNFHEVGIIVCTDVAKYEAGTTAEITQGAGAVAILVEKNPKLLELDLTTVGHSSKDVDDFFRPIGSETAKVKGRFSLRCYIEGLESALQDHCHRAKKDAKDVLHETDMFVLHVPYKSLPLEAMEHLLQRVLGMSQEDALAFLNKRGFQALIEPSSRSGNLYSGSMFLPVPFLLSDRFEQLGNDIVGKNILFASYGSGNTMIVIAGKVAAKAPEVIQKWNVHSLWNDEKSATFEEYERWLTLSRFNREQYMPHLKTELPSIASGKFYLSAIREDGYREYQFQK